MMNLRRISESTLQTKPYRWAEVDQLFSPEDAHALATTFPRDRFKRVAAYDGQKSFDYQVRSLIRMGERSIAGRRTLSSAWRALANDLLSPAYRAAVSSLTGLDLSSAPVEVNVFSYSPGGWQGPHPDHRDKIVTHVLYFNESWNEEDGGCLQILRSTDPRDVAAQVSPVLRNSVFLVRSDDSWHAVSAVSKGSRFSRLSATATFYRPGCVSTVWPSWHRQIFYQYPMRAWTRVRGSFRG